MNTINKRPGRPRVPLEQRQAVFNYTFRLSVSDARRLDFILTRNNCALPDFIRECIDRNDDRNETTGTTNAAPTRRSLRLDRKDDRAEEIAGTTIAPEPSAE